MTQGPRRLRDDPDFKWETGCDLADESSALGEYDLAGVRQRLLARVAVPPPPSAPSGGLSGPSWTVWARPMAGLVSAVAVVTTAYWLGLRAGSGPERVVRPAEPAQVISGQPPLTEPTEVAPELPVGGEPVEPPHAALESPGSVRAPPNEPLEVLSLREDRLDSPGAPVVPAAGAPAQGVRTSLMDEADGHELARDALQNERFEEARRRYDALRKVAGGVLIDEAELGLLQALLALNDARGTLELLDQIENKASLSSRRAELLRLRAKSLVMLDRCGEALGVAEALPAKASAEVRRACRQDRKETPP
jgi:hypothetical protein